MNTRAHLPIVAVLAMRSLSDVLDVPSFDDVHSNVFDDDSSVGHHVEWEDDLSYHSTIWVDEP